MKNEPEARIWATSTDLPDTNQERKRYFLVIEDDGKRIDVELIFGPNKAMSIEPFVPHEMDYTVHDACEHDNYYCVLDDPESFAYQDMWENEQYYLDMRRHIRK